MPGEENLNELSDQLATSEGMDQGQPQESFRDDNGQGERLLTTSKETPQTQTNQAGKMLAGKYKTPQELEKAYLNQNKGYQNLSQRQKQLEKMLENPRFQEMAANDPEMRDALGKLGYELMEEDTRQDERESSGRGWDGNTNSPDFKIAVLEHKQQLMWDRMEFQTELGRKLSDREWADIKREIVNAPRLSVRQAWKLTSHFEKMLEEKQAKALEAAGRRAPVTRPRPAQPGSIGGQKPSGKSPIGLGEGDKAQFIQDLIDKAGG